MNKKNQMPVNVIMAMVMAAGMIFYFSHRKIIDLTLSGKSKFSLGHIILQFSPGIAHGNQDELISGEYAKNHPFNQNIDVGKMTTMGTGDQLNPDSITGANLSSLQGSNASLNENSRENKPRNGMEGNLEDNWGDNSEIGTDNAEKNSENNSNMNSTLDSDFNPDDNAENNSTINSDDNSDINLEDNADINSDTNMDSTPDLNSDSNSEDNPDDNTEINAAGNPGLSTDNGSENSASDSAGTTEDNSADTSADNSTNDSEDSGTNSQISFPSNLPTINPIPSDDTVSQNIAQQNQNKATIAALVSSHQSLASQVQQQAEATKYQTVTSQDIPAPNIDQAPQDIVAKIKSTQLVHH